MSSLRNYALARMGVIPPSDFIKLNIDMEQTSMQKLESSWTEWLKAIDEEKDYWDMCNQDSEPVELIRDAIQEIYQSHDIGLADYILHTQFNMHIIEG